MIVEVEAVEFKELHHQHTKVPRLVDLSSSYLWVHLQEAHCQADNAVAPQSAREHLIHGPLAEKCLGNEYEGPKRRHFGEEPGHYPSHLNPVLLVDRNINGEMAMYRNKFDDGYFCLCNDGHFVRYPRAFERVGECM